MDVARIAYHYECGMPMIYLSCAHLAAVLVAAFLFNLAVQNAMAAISSMRAHAQCSRMCAESYATGGLRDVDCLGQVECIHVHVSNSACMRTCNDSIMCIRQRSKAISNSVNVVFPAAKNMLANCSVN